MAARVRYRFHGRFISESTARRYSNLETAKKYISSERVKIGGLKTTLKKSGFVEPEALQVKRPAPLPAPKPAPMPAPKPEPVAAPVPPAYIPEPVSIPAPRYEDKRSLAEKFEDEADQTDDLMDSFEEDPSLDLWREITSHHDALGKYVESGELSPESIDRFEDLEGRYDDLLETAPGEYDFAEELFGYDRFDGEDLFIEDMEILDLDTDEEYPEK